MKKRMISMLLAVCLILSMTAMTTACSNSKAANSSASTTKSFTDSAGRTVELPSDIARIVPSGSLAQMALFALAPDIIGESSSIRIRSLILTRERKIPIWT